MVGPRHYGALGMAFTVVRALEAVCLIAIIGMTANFIGEMVYSNAKAPSVLVGTLTVTCLSVLYCIITYILYLDDILPLLISAGLDALLLIAVVVVAVTVGKPISYLNCQAIKKASGGLDSAYAVTMGVGKNLNKAGVEINYRLWAGANRATCFEMKSIWGLSICLCILFFFSMVCCGFLWRQQKANAAKENKEQYFESETAVHYP